jgi:hypothetical protein
MFPIILTAALATVPGQLPSAHLQTASMPVVQMAANSQSYHASALSSKSNDSDKDFDNDTLHPDEGKR